MIFALLLLCLGADAASSGTMSSLSGTSRMSSLSGTSRMSSSGTVRPRPPCLDKMNITRIRNCLKRGIALSKTKPGICKTFADFRCLNFSRSAMESLWCPSCISPAMLISMCRDKVPTCVGTAKPQPVMRDTPYGWSFCPSCRPLDAPPSGCTVDAVKACYAKMTGTVSGRPLACKEGERPVKDGCCVSCLPPTVACFPNVDPRTFRNSSTVNKCITQQKTVPVCRNGTRPPIVSCCRSCRPMGSPDMDRPLVGGVRGKCTRANFQKALQNAPECELNERPLKNKDQVSCAPSCRRPSSSFKLTEVISCLKGLQPCAANSRPEFIPGDRCPTCKPMRPVCSVPCNASRVCIKKQVNGKWMSKCVRKGFLKMRITLKDAAFKLKVKALTPAEFREVVKEMLARFCERAGETTRCEKYKDRLDESMDVTAKDAVTANADQVDVTITTSFDSTTPNARGGRRLLQVNDPAILLKDAVSDTDPTLMGVDSSSNGISTGTTPVTPTNPTKSSGSKLVSGLITVVSMIVYLVAN